MAHGKHGTHGKSEGGESVVTVIEGFASLPQAFSPLDVNKEDSSNASETM